jgi:hypothetical protein
MAQDGFQTRACAARRPARPRLRSRGMVRVPAAPESKVVRPPSLRGRQCAAPSCAMAVTDSEPSGSLRASPGTVAGNLSSYL